MYISSIDRIQLLDRLRYAMTKKDVQWIAQEFRAQRIDPEELIGLCCSSDSATAFHSAWVLENILLTKPEGIDYYLPKLVELLPQIKNDSVKRHFTKLISIGVRRVVLKETTRNSERNFWEMNLEPIEELCFKWFVDEGTKPAVRVHSLVILYLLSMREPWIAEELPAIIENQMEFSSPGFRAKAKQILRLLTKA